MVAREIQLVLLIMILEKKGTDSPADGNGNREIQILAVTHVLKIFMLWETFNSANFEAI